MFKFLCLHISLGKSPAAKNAQPGQNLKLTDGFLERNFRKCLLEAQEKGRRFTANIDLPELPPLDVEFHCIGQTAGVAIWSRKQPQGNVYHGAASLYLNGLELDNERAEIAALFAARHIPLPDTVRARIDEAEKPVLAMLHRDLYYYTDPVLSTACGALGTAFFGLLGTGEEIET
jgi:hypothetical protein